MPVDSPTNIRQATLADAGDIARLTAQLGYDVSATDVDARLSLLLTRPDHHFLVAEVDGQPAGWLHASRVECIETDSFVMVAGLVVDTRYRRRGIGAALLRRADDWAIQQRCSLVRLWSSAKRTSTHRFYEHRGFTHIKTQLAFAKTLGGAATPLSTLVPRVEE